MSAAQANVIGRRQSVAAAELVPGDIILIAEGDTIPADARLIQSVVKRRYSPLPSTNLPEIASMGLAMYIMSHRAEAKRFET
jgi:Ca2+-transporting ATPase